MEILQGGATVCRKMKMPLQEWHLRRRSDGLKQQVLVHYDFALRLRSAQRCFIISEMRLRAAALMCRRGRRPLDAELLLLLLPAPLPAGLPRRRAGPSSAVIAELRRSRSL